MVTESTPTTIASAAIDCKSKDGHFKPADGIRVRPLNHLVDDAGHYGNERRNIFAMQGRSSASSANWFHLVVSFRNLKL